MPGPRGPRPISPQQFPKCAKDTLASILQTFRQHQGKVARSKLADIQTRIDVDVFCLVVDRRATRLTTVSDQFRLLQILAEFFTKVNEEVPTIRYQLFDVIFLGREGESFLHESRMAVLGKLCVHMMQFGPYSFYADVAQWLNRISRGSGKNYARGFVTDIVNAYMISEERLNMHEFLLPLREFAAEFTVYFLIFAIQVHEPERSWAIVFTEWLRDDATPFFAVVKENNFLAKEFASTTFNLIAKFDLKNSLDENLKKAYHEMVVSLYNNWKRFIGSPLNVGVLVDVFREYGRIGEEDQQKFLQHFCLANQMKSLPMAEMKRTLGSLPVDVKRALPTEVISMIELNKMNAELHSSGRADGSCLLQQGGTCFLAAVNGPRLCPMYKRDHENLKINLAYRNKVRKNVNRKLECLLRNVLEHAVDKKLFPRQQLMCNVQEIEGASENVAPAINAMCLALLDAAVPLHHLFCGVHISVGSSLEPGTQKVKPDCSFVLVFKPSIVSGGELIGSMNTGAFTMAQYEEALKKAQNSALQIFDFFREAMAKKFTVKLTYGVEKKLRLQEPDDGAATMEESDAGPSPRKKRRSVQ
ncbi:hypothetical protein QR680_011726 [Steinernema hermaphroditum]|uniref:Exoribonuclease phosphorolytic domain-containing protein n=1 Tax=Steinernema hermaphroditum TaxID=289476 RepID=A0AA39I109_9BILA|nr:hypothetical protein QR680_011726 [Steinernema hermaphroditum]